MFVYVALFWTQILWSVTGPRRHLCSITAVLYLVAVVHPHSCRRRAAHVQRWLPFEGSNHADKKKCTSCSTRPPGRFIKEQTWDLPYLQFCLFFIKFANVSRVTPDRAWLKMWFIVRGLSCDHAGGRFLFLLSNVTSVTLIIYSKLKANSRVHCSHHFGYGIGDFCIEIHHWYWKILLLLWYWFEVEGLKKKRRLFSPVNIVWITHSFHSPARSLQSDHSSESRGCSSCLTFTLKVFSISKHWRTVEMMLNPGLTLPPSVCLSPP